MTSYTAVKDKIKEDLVDPFARGTAEGSEKLAQGSEVVADATRRLADRTRQWSNTVTGDRKRRIITILAVAVGIAAVITALGYFFGNKDAEENRKQAIRGMRDLADKAS